MPTHVLSINEVTYSQLLALIAVDGLTPTSTYKITDRGDRGLYFTAISNNQLAKDGTRAMLCPAYYGTGEYNGDGNNWIGVWSPIKTAAINDLAIWGGKVWKNLTGGIGASVDDTSLDNTNWVIIPKSSFSNNEYTEMLFGVNYDVENDWIERQWDTKANIFGLDYASFQVFDGTAGLNYCDVSDWNYGNNNNGYVFFSNDCMGVWNNACRSIYLNSNKLYIFGNYNDGDIDNNRNGGGIYNNKNSQNISYNINNDHIRGCGPLVTTIYRNTNNGIISSTTPGAITDTEIKKL